MAKKSKSYLATGRLEHLLEAAAFELPSRLRFADGMPFLELFGAPSSKQFGTCQICTDELLPRRNNEEFDINSIL